MPLFYLSDKLFGPGNRALLLYLIKVFARVMANIRSRFFWPGRDELSDNSELKNFLFGVDF